VENSVDGVTLQFTPHALVCSRQRAVPLWAVSLALEVVPVFHNGDFAHCLTYRFLLKWDLTRFIGRLRGLMVVVRKTRLSERSSGTSGGRKEAAGGAAIG